MSDCAQCAKLLRENAIMKEMLDIIEEDGGDTRDLRKKAMRNLGKSAQAPHE